MVMACTAPGAFTPTTSVSRLPSAFLPKMVPPEPASSGQVKKLLL